VRSVQGSVQGPVPAVQGPVQGPVPAVQGSVRSVQGPVRPVQGAVPAVQGPFPGSVPVPGRSCPGAVPAQTCPGRPAGRRRRLFYVSSWLLELGLPLLYASTEKKKVWSAIASAVFRS
jgi:hypothetical protein